MASAHGSTRLPGAHLNPPLDEVSGDYRLRFAETEAELEAAQRLRFEVFNIELGEGLDACEGTGIDRDRFDPQCQHLIVEHGARHDVVGTYRLQLHGPASAAEGLYSAGEFDLSSLPTSFLDETVELGRACVHAEHRHRRVLQLLWRGLVGYVAHHGMTGFFGCSSLTSQDPADGLRFLRWLEAEGHLHPSLVVSPLAGWRCEAENADLDAPPPKVPRLFGMYLRQGAKVLGPPALDREFGTIDYLTYLRVTPGLLARLRA